MPGAATLFWMARRRLPVHRRGAARGGAAILVGMSALKAHVVNGQIILDEPAELAEGAELLVFPVGGEMSDDERAELERAIEEGIEDFERGDFEDARELGLRLLAKQ